MVKKAGQMKEDPREALKNMIKNIPWAVSNQTLIFSVTVINRTVKEFDL